MAQKIATWEALPTDVQHLVAQRVGHAKSLVSMRATCTSMRDAVDQNDVWEAARKRLAAGAPVKPALNAIAAFVVDVQKGRADCREEKRKLDDVRNGIGKLYPPCGMHGAAPGISASDSDTIRELSGKANKHLRDREAIVARFEAEGLRAKPYSPRQQLQRAVQAQVQALNTWWNG